MARILTCYYRPKPGGFCKRLFRGIDALLAEGHSVHYLAVEPFPIRHPECHFHRFPWPAGSTETLLFWALFHLFAPIQLLWISLRHSIQYAFTFGANYGLLLQPSRWLFKQPPAVFLRADTLENHEIKERPSWLIILERRLERWGLWRNRIWTVSRSLEQTIAHRHSGLRIESLATLPNEIPRCTATRRYPHQGLICGVVGVLEERKNQRLLLDCWRQLSQPPPLYCYGTGPGEMTLRLEAAGLPVEFMGWRHAKDIWSNIDILLFPSKHEGMPNAILEAIAYNVPVLASDIPPHREILGADNLLPLEVKHWTKRLSQYLKYPTRESHRLLESQIQASRHLRFNWEKHFVLAVTG
ncbi:glycosyltransferase family 4 protein [Thiocystis violacea]|uniref:glycosyltransferase family 4 protein n=1 Tax=Thiocystis violacea TaxID=13725 RepID=UPI001905BF6A|nr:glycosyltransferase family 4 protein [Thiocystis violacea]MBK1718634.1 hypothetical protein [Thiocystis violacea]